MCSEAEINTGFQLCSSIVTGSVGNTPLFITKVPLSPCWYFPKTGDVLVSPFPPSPREAYLTGVEPALTEAAVWLYCTL